MKKQMEIEQQQIRQRMSRIKHKILVLSGKRAQMLFEQYGIEVMVGAQVDTPRRVAESYLNGTLQTGANICDH